MMKNAGARRETRLLTKAGMILLLALIPCLSAPARAEEGVAEAPDPGATQSAEGTAKPDDSLDVTITGEAKDEIPPGKEPPPLDVPFQDVASLSREGQREQVLSDPVQHMAAEQQVKLLALDSRQTASPLLIHIPSPPFFRLEPPQGLSPYLWELQVVDQNNQVIKSLQGTTLPFPFLEWDGFDQETFKLRVGPAYTSILTVRDADGKSRRYFGEPIQLDALQYEEDGLLHIEFNNSRLYRRGSAEFSPDVVPLLRASLDIMRRRVGTTFRVVIYEDPSASGLSQKRLEAWKTLLQNELVISAEDITLVAMAPQDRGKVTALMMLAQP